MSDIIKLVIFLNLNFLLLTGVVLGNSWTIIANGPSLELNELKKVLAGQKILALDGGANSLKSLQIYPDCILGDFDSVEDPAYWGIKEMFSEIDEESSPYVGNFGIMIIPAKNQNLTDLEKGIIYCEQAQATSIFIVQATGGRMDLTLSNLGSLKKFHRPGRPLIILTEMEQIFYVCNADIAIEGGVGDHCSILSYPQALMTTCGLAYNGDKFPLKLGLQESVSNKIVEGKASISIEGEALIILPKSSSFTVLNPS